MAYYRVLLEATGIKVVDLYDGPPVVGFFTTRIVRAESVKAAEEAAKAMVLADWTEGEHAALNQGGVPRLRTEAVYASSWWQHLRFRNHGHTFFPEEDADAEQAVAADRPKTGAG